MTAFRRILAVLAVVACFATGCSSSSAGNAADRAGNSASAEPSATAIEQSSVEQSSVHAPDPTPTVGGEPTAQPLPAMSVESPDGRVVVPGAPLGTFVVAKPEAGLEWAVPLGRERELAPLAIPVHDMPGGPPRMLVDRNAIDGLDALLPLLNSATTPLVLRVIAGGPDDEYISVQAPTRPHDQFIWVQSSFFDFGFTDKRIEINLAGAGQLSVFDGDDEIFVTGIVQGRDSRPTPVHQTYLQSGIGARLGPAYGSKVLSMASWSEVIGTFGVGDTPKNYLHGTNTPELMGQRVSSGEVRLTNDAIDELITLVGPGTPITIFDSSGTRRGRDSVLDTAPKLAATMPFDAPIEVSRAVGDRHAQLWQHCGAAELVCRNPTSGGSLFAVALDLERVSQIPVYDAPGGGPQRTLLDVNAVDGVSTPSPLFATTPFDQPLVLPVVQGGPESDWLLVRVPVRPNGSTGWVRASDFRVESTSVRIEVDVRGTAVSEAGELVVYRDDEELLRAPVASGRDSRPSPLGNGWVHQIVDGASVAPAYGPWIVDFGMHSEALGTFGGGGAPRMAAHGTNQPETIGLRVSSGAVRLENSVLEQLVGIEGLLGAPVSIRGSGGSSVSTTRPAQTMTWLPNAEPQIPSFI